MNSIEEIIDEKLRCILKCGDPLSVDFTRRDIAILSNINQLRILKLKEQIPSDFEAAKDVFECTTKIIQGDQSAIRVLEFCLLSNRVLLSAISQVFPRMVKQ